MPSRSANGNTPGDEPPPGRWAAVSPPSGTGLAHLLPCPSCGALNGRSALACWDCEASLLTDPWSNAAADRATSRPAALTPHTADADANLPGTEAGANDDLHDPRGPRPASDVAPLDSAPMAMPMPMRPSADAYDTRLDLPVLTMAVAAPRQQPRRRWLVAGGVVAALAGVMAAVVALEFRRDATAVATREPAALPAPPSPNADPPAPAAAAQPVPAVARTPSRGVPVTLDFDSLPAPAAGPAAPALLAAEPSRAAPSRAAPPRAATPDAAPATRAAARATSRAAPAPALARPPARPPGYETPAAPPPTAVSPCAANVAALGLCSPAAP